MESDLLKIGSFIKDYKIVVYMLSLTVCAFFSFIMLTSYGHAKGEKWMKYYGQALGIFAFEYLLMIGTVAVPYFFGLPPVDLSAPTSVLGISILFILRVLSTANNILFIATARELENKPAFPPWSWWLAGGALVTGVVGRYLMPLYLGHEDAWLSEFVARSGDDIFSVVILLLLGQAIYNNISIREHRTFAFLAKLSAVIYALLYLIDWVNPIIANAMSADVAILDAMMRAAALPVQILLFYFVYSLFQRFVEILNHLTEMQKEIMDKRQDYLSSEGVVRLISNKLAGEVKLVILLPGESERRIASISCPSDHPEQTARVLSLANIKANTRDVLLESKVKLSFPKDGPPFIAIVPIEAHCTAIGCLKIKRTDYPFSQMALRQIKAIGSLISPAVQSYRELAALDLLSIRFAERQGDEKLYSPECAARRIAEIVHDVFSPAATSLAFDFGFQTVEPVYLGDAEAAQFIQTHVRRPEWDSTSLRVIDTGYKLFKKKLTATSEDIADPINRPPIGDMVFAVLEAEDTPGRPALGTNYLHRKAASTLASDAYFDFARDYFGGLLKKFGTRLSQRRMSVKEWFEPVEMTAREGGMHWVVASRREGETLGATDSLTQASIEEAEKGATAIQDIHEEEGIKIQARSLSTPLSGSWHIVRISLPGTETTIWLGIERPGFKDEIAFAFPWKNYLIDFARIAEAAITRITFAIELERKQTEAANYLVIARSALTRGAILHQLRNQAQDYSSSASALLSALAKGALTASDEIQRLIRSMKPSSEGMKTFLLELTNVNKTDDPRPSQLLEAVKQSRKLVETGLLRRGIELRPSVGKDIWVDVGINVVISVLADLISNAKDAMPTGGEIHVVAETNGIDVLCHVIDQGHGIPDDVIDKIFELGFTTKHGEGSGWGLWFVRESLTENGSKIKLTKTGKDGTIFTIYFPKAVKVQS